MGTVTAACSCDSSVVEEETGGSWASYLQVLSSLPNGQHPVCKNNVQITHPIGNGFSLQGWHIVYHQI